MQTSPAAAALLDLGIAITRLVRRHAARAHPAGLTLAEFRALSLLDATPNIVLKELAALMGLTPATASRLADRLVRRGLLRRRADAADRRLVRFQLSPRGARALRVARRSVEGVLAERLVGLSPTEARQVEALSARLIRRLRMPDGPGA